MISEKTLLQLEFYKILKYISKYAHTEIGKGLIEKTAPLNQIEDAITEGNFVTEAKEILIKNDIPPINYLPDLFETLGKTKIEGSVITIEQINDIVKLAEISRNLHQFLKTKSNESKITSNFVKELFVDKVFEYQITKVFNSSGDINDNASSKLKEIRNNINDKSERLRKTVNAILKKLSNSLLVQEEYITQRDGRIVLPVKAEHKRHVKGFIHSESATGQTVYIEPEESLELNNEILSLHFAERREVEKILKNITSKIGEVSDELRRSLNAVGIIDSIFAKAKYSIEIMGSYPAVGKNNRLEIIKGKHPLLLKKLGIKNTVSLNLKMDDAEIILITGPNAGGKTVVLKTIGLLTALVLSGLHIPADPDSSFNFCDNILLDIGDQQSIEDDLSTFSSHLSNINSILKSASSNSLILLDEIGTGTDPTEGVALASALLIKLKNIGSTVFATTHHGDLKILANDFDGFQNASMKYDLQNLMPTYEYQQGIPGSSYAFEVAERIGITKDLIELAKENLDPDKTKIEEFLIDLENKSHLVKEKLNDSERENARLKGLTELYQSKVEKLEKEKKDIILETKLKAENFLEKINKQFELTVKNIREKNASRKVIKEEKQKIEEIKKENDYFVVEEPEIVSDQDLAIGDFVKIKDTTTIGEIIDIRGQTVQLISGSIKLKAKLKNLIHVSKPKKNVSSSKYSVISNQLTSQRLDIRGRKPEEVEYEVLKFLDDAYTNNLAEVEILHGKGTGILKKTVHELLSKHQGVKNYKYAKIEFGGEGITVVELK